MSVSAFLDSCRNNAAKQLVDFVATLEITVTSDDISGLITRVKKGDGDLEFSVPKLNKFKKVKGNLKEFAAKWAADFKVEEPIVDVKSSGVNIIFTIDRVKLNALVLTDVLKMKDQYGSSKIGEGKTVIVEFSSPNIAKPFHAGHLRSTITGNFIQNVYRFTGHNVIGYNYLGDWGKQYGLLAVGFPMFGSRAELEKDPIRHLYEVYVKVNQKAKEEGSTIDDQARAYFARMEAGDGESLKLWKEFRDMSIEKYKEIYQRLNVSFDVYSGESQVSEGMEQAFETMSEKKLLELSQGATLINLESYKKNLGKVLIKKTDGSSLYITRDVAAAKKRYDLHKFDKMIYVVGAAQDLHFKQLFQVLKLMDYEWADRCEHVNFGLVNGMSTRKGTAVFLEDILDEAKQVMAAKMAENADKYAEVDNPDQVADLIGMSAVIIQDMSAKRHMNYDYNVDRMTRFEGETGPYLMYTHARVCSIGRKSGVAVDPNADLSLLTEPAAHQVIDELLLFPEIVGQVVHNTQPVTLVMYLFKLCRTVNSAFVQLQVKGTEEKLAKARMVLFDAARQVLRNGMVLIGLTPVERM